MRGGLGKLNVNMAEFKEKPIKGQKLGFGQDIYLRGAVYGRWGDVRMILRASD